MKMHRANRDHEHRDEPALKSNCLRCEFEGHHAGPHDHKGKRAV
jgi:hypothetical protein